MDLRRSTRWGNGLGQQSGKEWILVKFPELRTTRALRLATGPFKTDYPQGLRISIASSCSSASSPTQRPTESGEFLRVFEQNPWQGRTLLTQHGFPYFKAPQRVLIEFSQPVTARCFLIEQIAKGAGYDWSVAEFEIDTAESMEH